MCKGNECWPTVFLIGTQKAATTSLTWALSGLLCLATWRPDHVASSAHYLVETGQATREAAFANVTLHAPSSRVAWALSPLAPCLTHAPIFGR